MDQQVYRIREDKLEKLDELFLHLAKRAKKLNQPAPFYQIEAYHDVALVDRGPQPLDWGLTNPGQHWEQCIELTHTEDRELPVIGARRYGSRAGAQRLAIGRHHRTHYGQRNRTSDPRGTRADLPGGVSQGRA